jgi:hypothetical protein
MNQEMNIPIESWIDELLTWAEHKEEVNVFLHAKKEMSLTYSDKPIILRTCAGCGEKVNSIFFSEKYHACLFCARSQASKEDMSRKIKQYAEERYGAKFISLEQLREIMKARHKKPVKIKLAPMFQPVDYAEKIRLENIKCQEWANKQWTSTKL